MKKIDRETLINQLESVHSGTAARETVEQSACFVFRDGKVHTYNDEISCFAPCDLNIEAAVPAKVLLAVLNKLTESTIEIGERDGKLRIKAGRKNTGVIIEKDIILPIDQIEQPAEWKNLPEDFTEAIRLTQRSAGVDDRRFILTCVHIHPNWIEACNNTQILRYPMEIDIDSPVLIRGDTIKHIVGLGVTQYSKVKNWIHFRNAVGLVFSCRLYTGEFPDMSQLLQVRGQKVVLPKGLREATKIADVFASDNVETAQQIEIHIRPGRFKIKGESAAGFHTESRKIDYTGPPISFMISSKLLGDITDHHRKCTISENALFVEGEKYKFAAVLERLKEE